MNTLRIPESGGFALIVIVVASWAHTPPPRTEDVEGMGERRSGPGFRHRPLCGDVWLSAYHLFAHPLLRPRCGTPNTGLFIALFGEGVVHWPTLFSIALFPVIVLAYYLLARSEERKLEEQFGDEYGAYRKRVPMFDPRRGPMARDDHNAKRIFQ